MQKPEDLYPADPTEADIVVMLQEDGDAEAKNSSRLVLRLMSKVSLDLLKANA